MNKTMLPPIQNTAQLTDAFHIFNELSLNLSESYHVLEQQVAKLHQELAFARSERLQTLVEKEQLAVRLQKILAALPAGVLVLDGIGKIIDCNAAAVELLGGPLLSSQWQEVVEQSFLPVVNNPHERQLLNGKQLSITYSLLGDSEGQIVLLSDVTEMRSLQDMVHQQKHLSAMGEMVASMAHQVRTPLSTAILYASQLADSAINEQQQQRFSKKILERLHFLERQVNDMLIFAKKGRMAMETFSLPVMLEKINDAMEDYCTGNIHFTMTNTSSVSTMHGNENALRGAVMNLLGNAIEALQESGLVQLHISDADNEQLLFRIKDNGAGIDSVHQERIFEPFFTTRTCGTGLGLAVVNSVINAHQGQVNCVSQKGRGTEFSLLLPHQNEEFTPLISRGVNNVMTKEIDHATV